MSTTIAALYVSKHGPYFNRESVDAWDETRDARNYNGPYPVVAHPPCHLWVNFAAVNWKRYQRQLPAWYPGGTDGGCFAHALKCVLTFGGVLEHPAFSHAWKAHGLVPPGCHDGPGWYFNGTYWVCEVWQSAYGHQARKRTWLLWCDPLNEGFPLELNWSREPGTHQVGWFDRNKPTLGKVAANVTPPLFCDALIDLARGSR